MAVLAALRTRVAPALFTALGVALIAAGLTSYTDPTTAGTAPDETGVVETLAPTPSPTAGASASAVPSVEPSASPAARAFATRVVIPALNIDLPVVEGNSGYPLCNVAMYLTSDPSRALDVFGQPGEGRATYIYAHARDGMFGPIYELAIQKHQGRKMLGMIVQVYTSDDKLYLYEIQQVRLHQTSVDGALSATTEQLWLQTSEGPKGTVGKTQLVAGFLSVGAAAAQDAHPTPRPVHCG